MARAPPLDDPLELGDGLVHHGQGDHRHREDPVLVVEGPVLVHPLVQGVDDHMGEVGVVLHSLLDQAGQRGEHGGALDALLVEELEPGRRLAEGSRQASMPRPRISR